MTTTARPERLHRYDTMVSESSRWDDFKPRAGDIFVCTAPKCGTTWTQMICALLVHQTPDLPLPLSKLSRWIDFPLEPVETVASSLEAQSYRRVIKTHTPLDGLPYFDEASYVFCGRDPRDSFLSMLDHVANGDAEFTGRMLERFGLPADMTLPTDPNEMFPIWQTGPANDWTPDGFPFGSATYFAASYWAFRSLPNLFFLHYSDLKLDLDGEMRRLSAFLEIPVDEARWPALVEAASFQAMRSHADDAAPLAHLNAWNKNADFFRKARMEAWREVLSDENKALYERLSVERMSLPLKAWLEGGSASGVDPKGD